MILFCFLVNKMTQIKILKHFTDIFYVNEVKIIALKKISGIKEYGQTGILFCFLVNLMTQIKGLKHINNKITFLY